MLIDTTFAVVLFCCECGRMHLEEASVFTLHKMKKAIMCACSKPLGHLQAINKDRFMLSFAGAEAEDRHAVRFSRSLLATGNIYPFPDLCRRLEGGFVGSVQAVHKELEAAARYTDYEGNNLWADIHSPQVMFEVINKIDDLAGSGSICCGNCGFDEIGLEIFDSFILLYCSNCGNMYEIRAKYQEDVKFIRKVDFIELQPIREV